MRIACLTIKKIIYRTRDIYGVSARWSGIQTNSFALLARNAIRTKECRREIKFSRPV